MTRQERLAPNGIPRWIRCYDSGGETIDQYTVVFTGRYRHLTGGTTTVLGMSADPFHEFGQHSSYRPGELLEANRPGQWPPAIGRKGNLGRRVRFEDLPQPCQQAVWRDYADLWDISIPHNVMF